MEGGRAQGSLIHLFQRNGCTSKISASPSSELREKAEFGRKKAGEEIRESPELNWDSPRCLWVSNVGTIFTGEVRKKGEKSEDCN